jgi:hypothetical protein
MKILKMYLKIKYCEVNKKNILHIANRILNPYKLSKGQNMQKKIAKNTST